MCLKLLCLLGVLCLPQLTLAMDTVPAAAVAKVVDIVRQRALHPPAEAVLQAFGNPVPTAHSLQSFLHSFDPYATWTETAAHADINLWRKSASSGVGMDIVRNRAGAWVCLPYTDSAAEQAGVHMGDILHSVDGHVVAGAELDDVAVLMGDTAGTTVQLGLLRGAVSLVLTVTRARMRPPNVQIIQHGGFTRVRLWRFDEETSRAFITALKKTASQRLVLDLRGNSGGNLQAALQCAAALLPVGVVTVREHARKGQKNQRTSATGDYAQGSPVVIWQDNLTASSAEVFIAALVDNGRGISLGEPSFGKAQAQQMYSVGSRVLTLTTEALFSPQGYGWEGTGIVPQVSCVASDLPTLVQNTQQVFGSRSR